MNKPETRAARAAFVFAHAIGLALASVMLEAVLPFATKRAADALVASPIDVTGIVTGIVFRIPLVVVAAVLLLASAAYSPPRSLGRAWAYVLMAGLLFLDATSYRWLGEQGTLLHLRGTFMPLRAFGPSRIITIGLGAALATAIAIAIGSRLEAPLEARFTRRGVLYADALTWLLGALLASAGVVAGPTSLRVGLTPSVVALFVSPIMPATPAPETPGATEEPVPEDGIAIPPEEVRELLFAYQAVQDPEPLADPARPYCRAKAEPTAPAATPRNVTLVVLRGVGADAIKGATAPMPALARLAAAEASFDNIVAGADDPTQGLVQILAGVAPFAPTRYHEVGVIPRLPSLPHALERLGLDTSFVSTRDLSPGRERTLVSGLGFGAVVEPTFADEANAGRTAGDDDSTLEAVVARLDGGHAHGRFVATVIGSVGESATLPQRLLALDARLAAFVTRWRAIDGANGGVLVLVGDSAPPVRTAADGTTGISDARFHVPFVLVNVTTAERQLVHERAHDLGGLVDVAQTILGLEGQGAVGCFQGRDLLTVDDSVPSGRRLVSFAGPDQQFAYVFDSQFRWQIDRTNLDGPFGVFDVAHDAPLAHDLYDARDVAAGSNRDYVMSVVGVGRYLAANNRYVVGGDQIVVTPLPPVDAPVQIADAPGASGAEVLASVRARREAGFDTVVVHIAMGPDLEPRIADEPLAVALPLIIRTAGPSVRLAFDVDLLDVASSLRSVDAARRVALALSGIDTLTPPHPRPLVFPRDPIMAMSLAARTQHVVYVRVPGTIGDFVEVARGFGVDGIVFESTDVAGAPIERARLEGLYVAVAGVTTLAPYTPNVRERPDYVLVDSERPLTP